MKRLLPLLVLSLLLAAAYWRWQSLRSQDEWQTAWQQAQFRAPQMNRESALAAFHQRQRLTDSVPGSFMPDLDLAVKAEYETWRKQFEKGETDRHARLTWQGQTEASLKQSIRDDLRSQAWSERQVQQKAAPVTDAQALAWFNDHAEQMRVPELHHVFHLFLSRHDPKRPDRSAEIQALHQQLTRGKASFADLVAKHSEDSRSKDHAGDLGWVSASRMPAEFMEALKRTPVGVLSPPIETKLGWHLVRVSARHESRLPSFVEVREEIIALVDQQRREAALGQVNW